MIPVKLAIKAAFGVAKGWLFDALTWIARHPWQTATAIATCVALWAHLVTIPGLEADNDREVRAHAQTKENYRRAELEAAKRWAEERAAYEQQKKDDANEADEREREARRAGLDLAEQYIRDNRVQCPTRGTAQGNASGTAAPADDSRAQGGERSGSLPELVAVQADDVRICTENTVRLQAAREWASGLNE